MPNLNRFLVTLNPGYTASFQYRELAMEYIESSPYLRFSCLRENAVATIGGVIEAGNSGMSQTPHVHRLVIFFTGFHKRLSPLSRTMSVYTDYNTSTSPHLTLSPPSRSTNTTPITTAPFTDGTITDFNHSQAQHSYAHRGCQIQKQILR